jgi:hypothetical protein
MTPCVQSPPCASFIASVCFRSLPREDETDVTLFSSARTSRQAVTRVVLAALEETGLRAVIGKGASLTCRLQLLNQTEQHTL